MIGSPGSLTRGTYGPRSGRGAGFGAESRYSHPKGTQTPGLIRRMWLAQLGPRSFSTPVRRKRGIFPPPGAVSPQ
jgi:hypothetical protein